VEGVDLGAVSRGREPLPRRLISPASFRVGIVTPEPNGSLKGCTCMGEERKTAMPTGHQRGHSMPTFGAVEAAADESAAQTGARPTASIPS
jgi:hypothetical protein